MPNIINIMPKMNKIITLFKSTSYSLTKQINKPNSPINITKIPNNTKIPRTINSLQPMSIGL